MVALPAAIPVTNPVDDTVAIAVLSLVHVPPAARSLRLIVLPAQTLSAPVIVPADGIA